MKKRAWLVALVITAMCMAQQSEEGIAATSNLTGAPYPRIARDSHALFRLYAPDATKLLINVGGAKYEMTKSADSYWTGTSKPLVPGFDYYSLSLDGFSVSDPGSETYFGVGHE